MNMNSATTNRTAAAVKAATVAGSALGLSFGTARWANCKSVKTAYCLDYRTSPVTLEASPSGHWALRHRDRGCIANGQA